MEQIHETDLSGRVLTNTLKWLCSSLQFQIHLFLLKMMKMTRFCEYSYVKLQM